MSVLLEKAFKKASKLPSIEQNILARRVLDEIESDNSWDKLFADSEDSLAKMAQEALQDDDMGKTVRLDVNKL
ncbi:MAG: hypothetical protein DRQ51_06680 [Gammaproteobacteria bacterium]|nr:MAG: hypothetical protein DRQ51_06680 [Gammaproteobacteria bacterium]